MQLSHDIPFILIGGTALAAYGSSRITIDTDIAVKALDIDRIISLFYSLNLKMVIGVDENQYPLFAENSNEAILCPEAYSCKCRLVLNHQHKVFYSGEQHLNCHSCKDHTHKAFYGNNKLLA